MADVFARHRFGDLDIDLIVSLHCNEVHLGFIDFADGNIVTTAEQFEIHYIFYCMSAVTVSEAKQVVSEADVYDVVFSKSTQEFFAFDIESFYVVKEI